MGEVQGLASLFETRKALLSFLREDVGAGDITSRVTIPRDMECSAIIVCKSATKVILSGLEEAEALFEMCGCSPKSRRKDGDVIRRGERVLAVEGKAWGILRAERTALNLLMRMSGIATETARMVDSAGDGVTVLATRKTAPGLRYFDKKAVVAGGGGAHRMRLDDMILIKDNHIKLAGSAAECIRKARLVTNGSSLKIECEVTNADEAVSAIHAGADIIMLDNFTPRRCRSTIARITRLGLRNRGKIEVSGGVTLKNIRQFANARPDFISAGFLTHSAKAADFSLEIA